MGFGPLAVSGAHCALILVLALAGCASNGPVSTPNPSPADTSTQGSQLPQDPLLTPDWSRADRVVSATPDRHQRWAREVNLTDPQTPSTGDYAHNPQVIAFIERMESQGFDRAALSRLFSLVERDDSILRLMNRQWQPEPGPNGAWLRYRGRHLGPGMLDKGTDFWNSHADALQQASRQYGVEPEYIVAIIGIETRWGGYIGTHRVIDALTTLAFDYPRRSAYFTNELEQYLIMARDEGLDPLEPKGSFAGAMGLGQFMPSSFHAYAVDQDANGQRDLWGDEDAIGSVANYFASHGWQRGEAVAIPAHGGESLSLQLETGFDSRHRVADLRGQGLKPLQDLPDDENVSLIQLDVGSGYDYWLGLDNFFVITRYNRSSYYAMAVHQLAQALRERRAREPQLRVTQSKARVKPPSAMVTDQSLGMTPG